MNTLHNNNKNLSPPFSWDSVQNIMWDFPDINKMKRDLLYEFSARVWVFLGNNCWPKFWSGGWPAAAEASWFLYIDYRRWLQATIQSNCSAIYKIWVFKTQFLCSILTCTINITELTDLVVFIASVGLGWTWKQCSRRHIPYCCFSECQSVFCGTVSSKDGGDK